MALEKIPAFYFDPKKLKEASDQLHQVFVKAEPFPHIVIDDFIPTEVLDIIEAEFPKIDQIGWTFWGPGETKHTKNKNIEKVGTYDENNFGLLTRHFMQQLNSATFIRFLSELTGTPDIVVDPTYNHCGLHSTGRGGKLMVHTDTNRHPIPNKFHQRYNLILFVNKDWKEEYGGHLELWSRDAKRCVKKILPIFNRCVIFDTGKYSFHGHPHPLTCPEGRRRNSLAVYYYVTERLSDDGYDGFQNEVGWVALTSEEKFFRSMIRLKSGVENFLVKIVKKVSPPILLDGFKYVKQHLIKLSRKNRTQ